MIDFENHYDTTIWDPVDPEGAIEDPMHGPEAVMSLASIPPMPRADGSYYVFGGHYLCGANDFDKDGKPYIVMGSGMLGASLIRESQTMMDWVERYQNGELPPRDEMDYPDFDFAAKPRIIIRG